MGALAVVENFLSPITQPLNDLSSPLSDMQTTHTGALDQFEQLLKELQGTGSSDDFWGGTAAQDAVSEAEQYLTSARSLSAPEMTVDLVKGATNTALDGMEDAAVDLAADVADDTVLTEVTAAVDVADVAQAGLDPITDAIGIILTVIDVLLYMTAIAQFAWAIYQAIQTWTNAVNQAGSKPQPKLPKHPVASSQTAEELAKKYQSEGIDVDAAMIQELLNAGYTPEQIDEIINNLVRAYGKKGVRNALATLLTVGLTPAQAVTISGILPELNNPNGSPASSYLKGKPGDDVYADILAAMLMQTTQEAKAELSSLQSAIQKARVRKGSNLTQDEIIAAVESTGTSWGSLPPEVQRLLLGKGIPQFDYGNAIEALVKEKLQNEYTGAYNYYTNNLGLEIEPYTVLPDGEIRYPDFRFTHNGQTVVEDLTSKGNMPSKIKYDPISAILIAIGY